MGTFTVEAPNGKTYTIDGDNADGALAALKSHLAGAAAPDKYQQAAIDEQAQLKAKGIDEGAGLTRRLAHGATLGADSTILAAASTPLEMIKRGTFNPAEGYAYAKAREDRIMDDARKNTGVAGTVAEVLGGGVAGAGLAAGGVTAARFLAPEAGLLARSGAAAADGVAIGGVSGAMEGNGLDERASNAAKGAAVGGALGGVAPVAFSALGSALAPVVSNVRARFNPASSAERQVARSIQESGRTAREISDDVIQAGNEGQGVFTVADAMGHSGQRMLSTVARAPGEGRTAVVAALDARQAGQGRRVSTSLAEGFDSPQTAAQTEARMTSARGAAADAEYSAVRTDARPVNVVGTIDHLDRTIGTGPGQALQAPNDGIEAALSGFRQRLSRVNPDDFEAVARIRGEMADAAQNATQNGYGNRARLIRGAVNRLDTAMEAASPGHLLANRNFARASRNIEAVGDGRAAATRGRTEDTVPAFQALEAEGQQAFRAGYVDPLIQQAQGAAFGVNKARPLINDAFQAEAGAMAPGNSLMQRQLGREQTMFETRSAATGGSKTADNLNDHAAMSVDPAFIGQILTGNISGAVRSALHAGANALTGNTAAVRQEVANILLQRGPNMNPATLENMVNQVVARMQHVQAIVGRLGQAGRAGADVAVSEGVAGR